MKVTKSQLKRIIKEELEKALNEALPSWERQAYQPLSGETRVKTDDEYKKEAEEALNSLSPEYLKFIGVSSPPTSEDIEEFAQDARRMAVQDVKGGYGVDPGTPRSPDEEPVRYTSPRARMRSRMQEEENSD